LQHGLARTLRCCVRGADARAGTRATQSSSQNLETLPAWQEDPARVLKHGQQEL
jgi:hypothetical protein